MTDLNNPKILIVDDDDTNLFVLDGLLTANNFKIIKASNGFDAIELVKNENVDLVLLDLEMPVMNGYETCKAIRKIDGLKELPVIFLTAYNSMEKKLIGFEAGAQDFITKPFDDEELLSRIRIHIELKRNRDKINQMNEWLSNKVHEKTLELEIANNELKIQDEIKSNFLMLISHEVKSPLNGILGTLNLIKNQEHSANVKKMIDTLDTSIILLEKFAENANLLTLLITQKYPVKKANTNIVDIFQFSIIDTNEKALIKNITIEIDNTNETLLLNADRDLIFKSFVYVINNALENSPDNGKIIIKFSKNENNIIVSITDFGQCYSNETLSIIAMPFSLMSPDQLKKNKLSLFITKLIMELHNGNIVLYNVENAGVTTQLIFNF
jgi:two-component system sensor histidine kinase/response regulator